MASEEHQTTIDEFREALEKELESTVLPEVKDLKNAKPEDIIRDMHRVLAGNGGVARGLVYKVAAANAHVKCLDGKVAATRSQLDAQIKFCHTVTDGGGHNLSGKLTEAAIEQAIIARISKFAWKHKTIIGFFILLLLQALTGIHLLNENDVPPELDQKITKLALAVQQFEARYIDETTSSTNSVP